MQQTCLVRKRAAEMAASLLSEGYRVRFKIMLQVSCFIKLRHGKNGNVITIVGNYQKGEIKLFRNGKLRHTEIVQ